MRRTTRFRSNQGERQFLLEGGTTKSLKGCAETALALETGTRQVLQLGFHQRFLENSRLVCTNVPC